MKPGDVSSALDTSTQKRIIVLVCKYKNAIAHCLKLYSEEKHPYNAYRYGQIEGLKSIAYIGINRIYQIRKDDFRTIISNIQIDTIQHVYEAAVQIEQKNIKHQLHKELHDIKSKMVLAELNNQNTHDLIVREQEILSELGWEPSDKEIEKKRKQRYEGYREVLNKSGIYKVYRG